MQRIAIDAGGTSTRAVVISDDGACVGLGRAGRGNPISVGASAAAAQIGRAVAQALDRAASAGGDIDHVALAMAGGSALADTPEVTAALIDLGVQAPVSLELDLHAMFASGTWSADGYALVAGTGSTAVRVRGGKVQRIADGLGWLLGDGGSGFWIGQQVAHAAAAQLDGRGPATTLTDAVLRSHGVAATTEPPSTEPPSTEPGGIEPDAADRATPATVPRTARTAAGWRDARLQALVSAVYAASPLSLAALAPLVFADPDDAVSADIISRAATALTAMIVDLADVSLPGPLVVGGGLLAQQRLLGPVLAICATAGITGPVIHVGDGLAGAAVLALRAVGRTVDEPVHTRITQTIASLR